MGAARDAGDCLLITSSLSGALSHASRAQFFLMVGNLGFRFAPPQALCYRRAPRARANQTDDNVIGFPKPVVHLEMF